MGDEANILAAPKKEALVSDGVLRHTESGVLRLVSSDALLPRRPDSRGNMGEAPGSSRIVLERLRSIGHGRLRSLNLRLVFFAATGGFSVDTDDVTPGLSPACFSSSESGVRFSVSFSCGLSRSFATGGGSAGVSSQLGAERGDMLPGRGDVCGEGERDTRGEVHKLRGDSQRFGVVSATSCGCRPSIIRSSSLRMGGERVLMGPSGRDRDTNALLPPFTCGRLSIMVRCFDV